MENYLYIAVNDDGFIKIGITNSNPTNRINKFGRKFPSKFRYLLSFEIQEIGNESIETLLHELFNSQLLNVKYLNNSLNVVEFDSYTKDSPNGYTEVFLSNPIFLANCLTILHLQGSLTLQSTDLEKIKNLKEYPREELERKYPKEFKQVRETEKNKISLLKPVFNNSETIYKRNYTKFLTIAQDSPRFKIMFEGDNIYLHGNKNKTNAVNMLHGNTSYDNLQTLISKERDINNPYDIVKFANFLKLSNKSISVQRNNSFTKRDNILKRKLALKNNFPLKKALISECEKMKKFYHSESIQELFCIAIEDIKSGYFFDNLDLTSTKKNDTSLNKYVKSHPKFKATHFPFMDSIHGDFERLSLLIHSLADQDKKIIPAMMVNFNTIFRNAHKAAETIYNGKRGNYTQLENQSINKFIYLALWSPDYYQYTDKLIKSQLNITLCDLLTDKQLCQDNTVEVLKKYKVQYPRKEHFFEGNANFRSVINLSQQNAPLNNSLQKP